MNGWRLRSRRNRRGKRSKRRAAIYGVVGLALGVAAGIPLSYQFQSGLVRAFVSRTAYVRKVVEAVPDAVQGKGGGDLFGVADTLRKTVVATGGAGLALGVLAGARRVRS